MFPRRPLLVALAAALCLSACGGGGSDTPAPVVPGPPKDLGFTDSAASADPATVPPYTDAANSKTNQRGDARYATLETNAGVRVLNGFLAIWKPATLLVDAGAPAPAVDGFPAVPASTWSGIPGDASDGSVLNTAVHAANIQAVIDATSQRTSAQELAAYLDDRRNKGYSIIDGMGHRLHLPPEKVVVTIDRHANTSAASIPLALAEAANDGRIRPGHLVLMEAMGGGFTWGSALVRW